MYQQLIFGDKYISKDFLTNCFQEVIDEYSDAILRLSKSTAFGPILEEHSFKFDVNYFCMFPKQMKTICLDAGNLVNGESDLQNRVNYLIREIDTNSYLIRYIDIRVRNPKDVKTFINTEEYEKYLDNQANFYKDVNFCLCRLPGFRILKISSDITHDEIIIRSDIQSVSPSIIKVLCDKKQKLSNV